MKRHHLLETWRTNVKWLKTASPKEQRQLFRKFGPDHDTFVHLYRHGTARCIPYLIEAMKGQPGQGEVHTCMWDHCYRALVRITGIRLSRDHKEWSEWWQTKGRKLPLASFPLDRAPPDGAKRDARLDSKTQPLKREQGRSIRPPASVGSSAR